MPIYEYECGGCGNQFELRQGFNAEPVETCPKCQGRAQRRFHSLAVIYKGSGFYTTDYARKQVSEPVKASESANASESAKARETAPLKETSSTANDSPTPSDKSKAGPKEASSVVE